MKKVFVSSTFRDMHMERDLIQTKISPDLNDLAYKKRIEGIKFQDLRWGIDTGIDEKDKNKKILDVCLDEIDNYRPYFIVLLGDRYGWIPPANLVKETEIQYGIYDQDETIDKSITNLEIDYGFLKNPDYAQNAYAYFRTIVGDAKGTINKPDPYEKERVEALKAEIRGLLDPSHIHEYELRIEDDKLVGAHKFVQIVKDDMKKILFENQVQEEKLSKNQREIAYHIKQADEKDLLSSARKSVEEEVIKEINNNNVISIKGKSGNGKSTLMAKLYRRMDKDSIILFSSLTPKTTSAIGIMRTITAYIMESLEKENGESAYIEINTHNKQAKFEQSLSVGEKKYQLALREYFLKGKDELIILIDAIDQLDRPEDVAKIIKPINFINDSKIKFIISYMDDGKENDEYIFLNEFPNYKLGDLTDKDKLEVINTSLRANNKQLPDEIKRAIIKKDGSKSPLYISLLVQRLLMMDRKDYQEIIKSGDGYEKISAYQKDLIQKMPNGLKDMILKLISYATKTLDTNTDDIKNTLNYLAISRRGLRGMDLKNIYKLKGKAYNSLDFASLKKYLRAFFLEDKYLRVDFTHKIIRQAILDDMTYTDKITFSNDIANALMDLRPEDPIKLEEQYYLAYFAHNKKAAVDLLLSIGANAERIAPQTIESTLVSIIKTHNTSQSDEKWVSDLFKAAFKFDLNIQKVLLAYFVYSDNEDGTIGSIKASTNNGKILLAHLEKLLEYNLKDYDIMRLYADQLSFLAMKISVVDKDPISLDYMKKAVGLNEVLVDNSDANMENLANVYANMAKIYLRHGFRDEAKTNYEKSIDLFEKLVDKRKTTVNLENLALAYSNIANLYSEVDWVDRLEAKKYYKESIRIINNLLKKYENVSMKKTVAVGYINMASLYFRENNMKRAEKWYFRAIDAIKWIENMEPSLENKEALARAYNNVADLFADEMVNDREKAEEFYLVAEGIFESILKIKAIISVKKNLATTYGNIGNLYSNWKEDEAYSYYLKSIEIKEEVLGLNSSREEIIDLATSYNNLGFLFVDTNKEKAIYYYEKAIKTLNIIENKDKTYWESLGVCYTNLADLYHANNEREKSKEYYKKAIEIYKSLIERYQDDEIIEKLLIIYNNLACYMTDTDLGLIEVEEEYIKAIELIKAIKDPYSKRKKTAIIYNNLANLYFIKDRNFELSEKCYLKSIDLTKWLIGQNLSLENMERLMVNYYNLSKIYELWGKDERMEECYKIANFIDRKIKVDKEGNIKNFIYKHKAHI
ncbi:tetratricopeptide repeat protein [Anaerococcus sp. Marseille-Q7828]|uniref:tetratricopeptide repeat protein n=1 Tax=Anaerococcus sp. Marseille-Q7828 TaxID=3036300 RepID=UPI0024AE6A04|nr:tetratricopeptide repeat protein [Anaerococcus sp. Marseille-Q7828]